MGDNETWTLTHAIGYDDRHHGQISVPNPAFPFNTDLTSVPQIFTWLVPKTGTHLPAALIHDGLIPSKQEKTAGIRTYAGPPLTEIQSDRVFRDAMADLGTPLIRRWLVWSAVSLASVATIRSKILTWYMYLSLVAVVALGYLATLQIFEQIDVLPWMRQNSTAGKLLGGVAGALVIPLVLAIPWALVKLYKAGWIVGWALALLLHVTLVVALITLGYLVAEYRVNLIERSKAKFGTKVLVAAVLGVIALIAFTIWICRRN